MLIFRSAVLILLLVSLIGTCPTGAANRPVVLIDEPPKVSETPVISAIQTDARNETSIAVSRVNDQIIVGASKLLDSTDQPAGRTNTRIAYYYSSDGGQTWGTGLLGMETPQKVWGRASDPSVASDLNGNFYIGALMLDNTNFDSSVYIFKSTDNGRTFGDPTPVIVDIGNPKPKLIDKCYITIDTSPSSAFKNTIHAVWVHKEENAQGQPLTSIFASHRRPGEASFSAPKVISHPGDMRGPSLTTGPNGELYAAWLGMPARTLLFNASTDGGQTFLPNLGTVDFKIHNYAFSMDPPDAPFFISGVSRINSFPVIDADRSSGPNRGMIYVAWSESRNRSDADIFLERLTPPNGDRPEVSALVRVNNDASGTDQFFPWLSVDSTTGAVEVAFYDRRDNPGSVLLNTYLARSTDGGASFPENIRVSSASSDPRIQANVLGGNGNPIGIGDYIAVASLKGRSRLLWTDTRRGAQEIFFGEVAFEPAGGGGGGGGSNAPPNDGCQTPRVISSLPDQVEVSTVNATVAPDDPVSCIGGQGQSTVWYSITPSVNTWYGIDTNSSDYDTVLSVYTGVCGSLTRVACNDDFNNSAANRNRALLVFQAQAGVTYLIQASGKGGGGTLRLRAGHPTITNVEFKKGPDGEKALRITGAGFADGSAVVTVIKDGEVNVLPTTFFAGEKQADGTVTVIFGTKKKLKKLVKSDETVIVSVESPAGSGRVSNQFAFTR